MCKVGAMTLIISFMNSFAEECRLNQTWGISIRGFIFLNLTMNTQINEAWPLSNTDNNLISALFNGDFYSWKIYKYDNLRCYWFTSSPAINIEHALPSTGLIGATH